SLALKSQSYFLNYSFTNFGSHKVLCCPQKVFRRIHIKPLVANASELFEKLWPWTYRPPLIDLPPVFFEIVNYENNILLVRLCNFNQLTPSYIVAIAAWSILLFQIGVSRRHLVSVPLCSL